MDDTSTDIDFNPSESADEELNADEEFDDWGNVLRVGDITFCGGESDDENDGGGVILGSGSYATVRLARRRRTQTNTSTS
ncbi:MAG: hypothetical protein ACK55I_39460, partial [bacterium]